MALDYGIVFENETSINLNTRFSIIMKENNPGVRRQKRLVYAIITNQILLSFLPYYGATAQIGPWPPLLRFLNHTIRHTIELLWTSDQPVAEASTYTGQHNI
jgi:hypothetical protein